MIHDAIMKKVEVELNKALIDDIPTSDLARVGVVKLGDLQGEPDPDVARISITLHENDPDMFIKGALTETVSHWMDEVEDTEIGGAVTWKRRFTIKCRVLLDLSRESLEEARRIASTVRGRIERCLLGISFYDVEEDGEYVARGCLSDRVFGETFQSGGPPDSYDFHLKIRFEILTTKVDYR